jgi:hypothetical protein
MNRSILIIAALLLTGAAAAQTPAEVKPGKFSVHFGATALAMDGGGGGGVALSLGLLATPKDLFMFEFDNGFGTGEQIGTYSYRVDGSGDIRNDGKIHYGYNSVMAMVSYSRLFDLSDKWRFRVGPAIGTTGIIGSDRYTDGFEGTVQGLPDPQKLRKNVFTAGVIAGVRCNFSPRGSLDINYMLAGHEKIVFEARDMTVIDERVTIDPKEFGNLSHRFNVTVGWRLGRSKK